jgi:hypothetical protein
MGTSSKRWFTERQHQSIAVAVSGWVSLSLVLAFWSCCQAVANVVSPVVSAQVGAQDHGKLPGPQDPCRTWIDNVDVALNISSDFQVSKFEPKIGHAIYAATQNFPAVARIATGRQLYHASISDSLPLYLRLQRLLI